MALFGVDTALFVLAAIWVDRLLDLPGLLPQSARLHLSLPLMTAGIFLTVWNEDNPENNLEDVSKQISEMRASGMGWGKIAQQVNVHPSYFRRGRSKVFNKHDFSHSKYSRTKSEIKAATARSYKGNNATKHNSRPKVSKGKSFGQSRAKDLDHSAGRGHALGHSKGRGGNISAGHSNGHGGGNSGGNGGGNGK